MKPRRPYDNEGRDNMLTQGIKRWLQSLFAWWPWRSAEELDYAPTTSSPNRGTSQETLFHTAVDGPLTQPAPQNIITISIEATEDEAFAESSEMSEETLFGDIHENQQVSSSKKFMEERKTASSQAEAEPPQPTTQQRLEFLRYLVQRGIVSDDL